MPVFPPPFIFPVAEELHRYDCYNYLGQFVSSIILYPSQVYRYQINTGLILKDKGVWEGNNLPPSDKYQVLMELYHDWYDSQQSDDYIFEVMSAWAILIAFVVVSAIIIGLPAVLALSAETLAGIAALSAELTQISLALHLSTVLAIHNLAYMLSGDYRKFWKDFYKKIGKISKALGYDTYYLALALRNSRTLFIDASTSMGLPYNTADMMYLESLSKYLWRFSANAKNYSQDTEELFFDLNDYLERKQADLKAGFIRKELTATANITSVLTATVRDIITLRSDIDSFVTDLPPAWSRKIESLIGPIMKKFDNFIANTYKPEIKRIWDFYNVFKIVEDRNSDNIFQLAKKTDNPFKMLTDAWIKPIEEILGFENKIIDLTAIPLSQDAAAIVEIAQPTVDELLAGAEREIITPAPVNLLGLEVDSPRPIFVPASKIRLTWFVGDF